MAFYTNKQEGPMLHELLKSRILIFKIIWLVMTLSMPMLVMSAFLIAKSGNQHGNPANAIALANIAIPGAILCLIAFVAVKKIFLSDEKLKVQLAKQVDTKLLATNHATGLVDEDVARKIESLTELEKRLLSLPNLYFLPFLLGLVFSETITILGFILAITKGDPNFILPFAGLSIALNIANFPKLDSLIERAKNLSMSF